MTSSVNRPVAAVICNPVNSDPTVLRAAIDQEADRNGWGPSLWFQTTVEDPGQNVTAEALALDPAILVVVGGDGTIRAVAEAAHDRALPLAVIPTGTGNLLARNLKLPLGDLAQSVRTVFAGVDTMIDVGRAEFTRDGGTTDRYVFLVMAGIGLDASMAANTDSRLKKRFGWIAYSDPIARSVFANKQIRMYYRLDNDRFRTIRAHTVIVGNCGTLTANILLLPDAKIDDGLLDVVVLSPKGVGGWLRIGVRLALHRFLHRTKSGKLALQLAPALRALQYAQARTLHADFGAPHKVQLDGDNFGLVTSVTISVQPGALTIRLPRTPDVPAIGEHG
ncbi:MAG: diacylglycerol kinase family protein [Terrimesophilobacter sp.]